MRARIAAIPDAGEVAALLDAFNAEFDWETPGVGVLTGRVESHIQTGQSVFLLAGAEGTGVAQLRFREYLFSGTGICMLEELYVVPPARRAGHGRALCELAFEVARDHGAESVELNTSVTDPDARRLYESLGFTNLEIADDPDSTMLFYERSV